MTQLPTKRAVVIKSKVRGLNFQSRLGRLKLLALAPPQCAHCCRDLDLSPQLTEPIQEA